MEEWATPFDALRLTFIRNIIGAARDPQAESFPLLELASAIIRSPVSPELLFERFGPSLD